VARTRRRQRDPAADPGASDYWAKHPPHGRPGHPLGTVYLLHFAKPLWGIRHYIGWTSNLRRRIHQHANGLGSTTTRDFFTHNIPFTVARLWHNSTDLLEQQLIRAGADRYCPICGYESAMHRTWDQGRAEIKELGLIANPEWF